MGRHSVVLKYLFTITRIESSDDSSGMIHKVSPNKIFSVADAARLHAVRGQQQACIFNAAAAYDRVFRSQPVALTVSVRDH